MHEVCQIRVPHPPPAVLTSSKHALDECSHCWPWICDLCLYLTPNPPLGEVTSSHLQFTLHPASAFGRTTVKEKALELYLDTLTRSSPGISCTCSCCRSLLLSILCIIPVHTLFPLFWALTIWQEDHSVHPFQNTRPSLPLPSLAHLLLWKVGNCVRCAVTASPETGKERTWEGSYTKAHACLNGFTVRRRKMLMKKK